MKITIYGASTVGVAHAIHLASVGHEVTIVDDWNRIELLRRGNLPVADNGARRLTRHLHASGRLAFETLAGRDDDVSLICHETDRLQAGQRNGELVKLTKAIGRRVAGKTRPHGVVVVTPLPPGTLAHFVEPALAVASGRDTRKDLWLAVMPENIRPGNALQDLFEQRRVIIGCQSERGRGQMNQLLSESSSELEFRPVHDVELWRATQAPAYRVESFRPPPTFDQPQAVAFA